MCPIHGLKLTWIIHKFKDPDSKFITLESCSKYVPRLIVPSKKPLKICTSLPMNVVRSYKRYQSQSWYHQDCKASTIEGDEFLKGVCKVLGESYTANEQGGGLTRMSGAKEGFFKLIPHR
ncbi:hypothetical protein OSB04_031253 [Centaurea solstitialis]|uniref:Uncharacterized protein n=1 Tax=Centaurea solstitialis TaxID=347529 RepID=A0AA38W4K0_9ASTR|nr:hypothetical protein OSB04_031253 [Centaurea solstitialis]